MTRTRLDALRDLLRGAELKVTWKFREPDKRVKLRGRLQMTQFEEYQHRVRERLRTRG